MSIEVLSHETIYQGRAFNVQQDKVRYQNGHTSYIDIVEHVGAVTILPVDADGNILFIHQYRHPTGKEILELPAGTLHQGEAPVNCAAREIREETGYAAGKLIEIGEFFLAPGYSTEFMYVFLATDLHHAPLPGDIDEDITLKPIPIAQAYELAHQGELQDGKSLAALLLAEPNLQKS